MQRQSLFILNTETEKQSKENRKIRLSSATTLLLSVFPVNTRQYTLATVLSFIPVPIRNHHHPVHFMNTSKFFLANESNDNTMRQSRNPKSETAPQSQDMPRRQTCHTNEILFMGNDYTHADDVFRSEQGNRQVRDNILHNVIYLTRCSMFGPSHPTKNLTLVVRTASCLATETQDLSEELLSGV